MSIKVTDTLSVTPSKKIKIRHIFAISDGDSVTNKNDQRQSLCDGFFDPFVDSGDTFFAPENQTALFGRGAGLCPTDYLVFMETAELRSQSHLHSLRVSVAENASVNLMDKSDGGNAP
jgi:hypothetical protein